MTDADVTNSGASDSGIGRGFVRTPGIAVAVGLILITTVGAVYLLVSLWPTSTRAGSVARIHVFGGTIRLGLEQQLFWVVTLAGALGGLLHSIRSLYWYVGNRALKRSWLTMYVCLPFVGAAMAVVFYLVLRGGLVPAQGGAGDVNVFGFAAVSALVGLFSPQAAEKLKQIFNTLLTPAETGKDQVSTPNRPHVTEIRPASGPAGTEVLISGTALGAATGVLFGDTPAPVTVISQQELSTTVPAAAIPGRRRLVVRVGDALVTGPPFSVDP
jgi:hypothetical protein